MLKYGITMVSSLRGSEWCVQNQIIFVTLLIVSTHYMMENNERVDNIKTIVLM